MWNENSASTLDSKITIGSRCNKISYIVTFFNFDDTKSTGSQNNYFKI